jgi:UDP-N-acetylmuramoyl-L-alanyl-D-glutamate--2,6-diaminopimelate ligase
MLARIQYGNPSKNMRVIGITGTNGKTTTSNLVARILEENGESIALSTTINFQLNKKKWDNLTKMTSLGKQFVMQSIKHLQRDFAQVIFLPKDANAFPPVRWGMRLLQGLRIKETGLSFSENFQTVIPLKRGIQRNYKNCVDSRFRGNDKTVNSKKLFQ